LREEVDAGRRSVPRCEVIEGCPVCERSDSEVKFAVPDFLHAVPGKFTYVGCSHCRTVYQNPRVVAEDMHLCYPDEYFTHLTSDVDLVSCLPSPGSFRDYLRRSVLRYSDGAASDGLPAWIKSFGRLASFVPAIRRRARFGLMDALATPGNRRERCLEVGCGKGHDLLRLARVGWNAMGLDSDPAAAEAARSVSGCDVKVGTISSVAAPEVDLQLIYMNHVVEHIPDLRPSLQRCHNWLARGGRVVLVYPNPESIVTSRYGGFSPNWDPPRHLVLPPRHAMVTLLERIGFTGIKSRTIARAAALYRAVACRSREGYWGNGFATPVTTRDLLFKSWESLFVAAGTDSGEEIVIVATKK